MPDEKSNGFEFAITLLVAFGSIVSATIIYFQNYAVDIKYYGFSAILLSSIFGLIFFLLLYIFIKGASMEMQDPMYTELKGKTDKFAAITYSVAFLLFLMLFPMILIAIILLIIGIDYSTYGSVMFLFSFIFSIIIGWPNIVYIRDSIIDLWNTIPEALTRIRGSNDFKTGFGFIIALMVLILSVLIWSHGLYMTLNSPLLQGQVTVDMESIYFKNGAPIPVKIQVTGPNIPLSINIYNETSWPDKIQLDLIEKLEPYQVNRSVPGNNSILVGNSLGNGKYNVFIDANKLSEGYYELRVTREFYKQTDAKGFYLSKASEKWNISERKD